MAGAYIAFRESNHKSLKSLDEAGFKRFVDHTCHMVRAVGQDQDVPSRDQSNENFYTPDETCRRSGDRERLRMAAAGKYGEYYEVNNFVHTFLPVASVDLGLIVVARNVAVRPAYAKYEHPKIATLLLADCFWRPFALFKGPDTRITRWDLPAFRD